MPRRYNGYPERNGLGGAGKHMVFAAAAACVLYFAYWLGVQIRSPAYAFFSGDQGLMLLQMREMAAHGWGGFTLSPPGLPEAVLEVFPKPIHVLEREGQWYPVFPPLLPFLSLPFHALLGAKGLFVIPLLSVLATLGAIAWVFHTRGLGWQRTTLACALCLLSAFSFYGLEFWGHAPAAFLALLSMALLVQRTSAAQAVLAGAVAAGAVYFRQEMLLFVAALAASRILSKADGLAPAGDGRARPALRERVRCAFFLALGAGLAIIPNLVFNIAIAGHPLGAQFAYNARLAGPTLSESFWNKLSILDQIMLGDAWLAVIAGTAGALMVAWNRKRLSTGTQQGLLCAIAVTAALLAFVLPTAAWQLLGTEFRHTGARPPTSNFWFTSPAFAAGLPFLINGIAQRKPLGLWGWTVLLYAAAFFLTTPILGTGQWGPRLLLPIFAPLAMMIAVQVPPMRSLAAMAMVVTGIVAGTGAQAAGAAYLLHLREKYADTQDQLTQLSQPDEIILTNYPFLYQICAPMYERNPIIYTRNAHELAAVARALDAHTALALVVMDIRDMDGLLEAQQRFHPRMEAAAPLPIDEMVWIPLAPDATNAAPPASTGRQPAP